MKTIHIPVLYGSQTGNSEAAAKSLASTLPETLTSPSSSVEITSNAMELDDFLEHERGSWSPLTIIICSSYGVGQAPIGAWKFREMCDVILEEKDGDKYANHFKGLRYALLGLGDSKFTTFFLNPTAFDSALSKAGAERVGSLGKADASGQGEKLQSKVIEDWCRDIVQDLKRVVEELGAMDDVQWKNKEEEMAVVKGNTGELCRVIYEDWDKKGAAGGAGNSQQMMFMLLGVILAILLAMYFK